MSGATQDTPSSDRIFDYGAVTRYGSRFHGIRLIVTLQVEVLQPRPDKSGRFGLFRVRSPLLTESILFLFLRLLRCFTSPRITLPVLCIQTGVMPHYRHWVAPFGDLRIKACVPLPEAFRSLLRPSSSDVAKAFTYGCNWFMQTSNVSGVYLTHLQLLTLNFQRTKFMCSIPISDPERPSQQARHGGPRWT